MADQKAQLLVSTQYPGPSHQSDNFLSKERLAFEHGWMRLRQTAHKFWLLEFLASFFSLVVFGSIVGILLWYNGNVYEASNTSSDKMKRPHIYTILALLSALMRATMLLPVATAIGQLKWSWFRSSRRLVDIERFDEATRGIYGSAKLFFYLRFRNLAVVGAALTIVALPLDALIQSVVLLSSATIPLRELNTYSRAYADYNDTVFLERAASYTVSQTMTASNDTWPEIPMINAVQFGQGYTNGLSDIVHVKTIYDCPTGHCEYKTAQTLSIDYQCATRSDILWKPRDKSSYEFQTLPGTNLTFFHKGNGFAEQQRIAIESYAQWPDKSIYPTYETDIFGTEHDGPLIVRTAMLFNSGNDTLDSNGTNAMECALFWTVKTTQMYVNTSGTDILTSRGLPILYTSNGTSKVRDERISVHTKRSNSAKLYTLWLLTPEICIVEGQEVFKSDGDYYYNNCVHLIGRRAGEGLQNMLTDPNYGLMGDLFVSKRNEDGTLQWNEKNLLAINIERATWYNTSNEISDHITTMWHDISLATSFTVRQSKSMLEDGSRANLYISGVPSALVFYYLIDWPRLAIPAAVLLCCATFVLWTALLTRKEYAWRRSALPLLFHGLENQEQTAHGDIRDFTVMQNIAENLRVRLTEHADSNGARFTTQ